MSEQNSVGPRTDFADYQHAKKYRGEGEDFRAAMGRVAGALQDDPEHYQAFRDILLGQRFMPAGRVQSAMGSAKNVTAYNCFVSGTVEDSFVEGEGSIMHRAHQAATTMRMGGGIGYDFSTLRPRGQLIRKLKSRATGPVSFMGIFNEVGLCTSSTDHRRGAQMGVLRIDHPDVREFLLVKNDLTRLTGFNVSIGITDEFMAALKREDDAFDLRWGGEVYETIRARELWDTVMRSTWDYAEPGVLFLDTINRDNNLHGLEVISATNPCVTGDTPVLTRRGWLRIDSLLEEPCDVWNGEEWSTVQCRQTGTDQTLTTVRLTTGQVLTCTLAHRWVMADGSRRQSADLSPGEEVAVASWPVVEGGRTVAKAYTQGFFSGDGWFNGDGRPYVSFKKKSKKACVSRISHQTRRDYEDGYCFLCLKGNIEVLDKTFVPGTDWSVQSRLDWLAGLADADGTLAWSYRSDGSRSSAALQVHSTNEDFIRRTVLLLNTLGASAALSVDRREREYGSRPVWCFQVRGWELRQLQDLGFSPTRLDLTDNQPARSCRHRVFVESNQVAGTAERVFCFTEEKIHQGCFNGVMTSQCGEQPLPPFGACLLGSFNLVKYLRRRTIHQYDPAPMNPESWADWTFDFSALAADVPHVVRAMDNVVDRTTYPLPEQAAEARAKRRMGLGPTGLANAVEALGYRYGDPGFVSVQHEVLRVIRDEAYRTSALLAREKGPFPLWELSRFQESAMWARLPGDVQELISAHGMRNSHLTSVAPTVTISLTADNVSSGIEPVYAYQVRRTYQTFEGPREALLEDYGFRFLGTRGKRTRDLTCADHLAVLKACVPYVDSAVSKTVNVEGSVGWEEFKQVYVDMHEAGVKGGTTFRKDGKRFGIMKDEDDLGEAGGTTPTSVAALPGEGAACYIDPGTGTRVCGD